MFQSVIGQEYAVAALQGALRDDRLPGTYLFVGPEHVGKSLAARELAKAINCTNPPAPGESCDQCRSCRAIDSGSHPDVRTVQPSGPSRTLRIAQFWPRDGIKEHPADRAMLRDLQYAPILARRRVFIVEDAEAFHEDTANSLLKVLEEPPRYAIFVLTAPATTSVLPTIASRALAIRFRLVAAAQIEQALIETRGLPADRAHFLAAYSQGRIGTAFTLADQPALLSGRDMILDIAEEIAQTPHPIAAFRIAEQLRKAAGSFGAKDETGEERGQRANIGQAMDILALWYGDLLSISMSGGDAAVANIDRADSLSRAAERWTAESVERSLSLILDTRRYIERNANAQIALETLVTGLISPTAVA